jgi:type II secretory pathway component PulF
MSIFKVDETSLKFFQLIFKKKRKDVTTDDLIFFTKQILSMYKAGFTLSSSMAFIEDQTESENLRNAIYSISLAL